MAASCLPPLPVTRPPRTRAPDGACDCHFHVIGPLARFPLAPERAFEPAEAPLESALAMHRALGLARGVIVQCNPHGTDNRALLDALQRAPERLRGVAIVPPDIGRAELRRMADAGVRALRFHHMPGSTGFSPFGLTAFERLAPLMHEVGLHLQLMIDAAALADALPLLRNWTLPVVIDHMGNLAAERGRDQPGMRLLCRLLAEGRIWVKVSAPYRLSGRYPDYEDVRPLHEALVAANPERILWGSDWPHTRLTQDMPEDARLLDLFTEWTPAALRAKILVENPQQLYGF